jgi:flagellin
MRINHNIAALNTYRQLSANTVNTSRSLEKLSSGLRINRAGDDAAGLAISEKMRSQIRGLETASRNANDGISLIQTAEGALNETHSILQRMKELAVQAANDTNTETDRAEIQKEIDQLKTEITRIAEQTEFNTKKLLDGSMSIKAELGDDSKITNVTIAPEATLPDGEYTIKATYYEGVEGQEAVNATINNPDSYGGFIDVSIAQTSEYDGEYTIKVEDTDGDGSRYTLTLEDTNGPVAGVDPVIVTSDTIVNLGDFTFEVVFDNLTAETAATYNVSPYEEEVESEDPKFEIAVTLNGEDVDSSYFSVTYAENAAEGLSDQEEIETTFTLKDQSMVFHIGANSEQNTKLSINNMDAASLGVDEINLETQEGADAAIKTIDDAISKVSSQRAALGAMQNRLEHTINNLGTAAENLTAAESRIRDVDMAKEMMEFTKNNILSQASQAMLAQANLQPQSVLQLLQ